MSQDESPLPAPEFSRILMVDTMPSDRMVQEISATPAECAALARRFDLVAIHHLHATVNLRRYDHGAMVAVSGTLDAAVVQSCIVSLEPVDSRVEERFGGRFTRTVPEALPELDIAVDADALDEDPPEAMDRGGIDLGELVAQHLSLALDPYPRHPDVVFSGHIEDAPHGDGEDAPEAGGGERSPFAALAPLKRAH